MGRQDVNKKITAKIPHAFEERIVELSLQNPEFGAKRLLPLLNLEDIDVSISTVYNILKRNGLQNRDKRLVVLEAQQAFEAMVRQDVRTPRLNAVPIPAPAEEPLPLPEDTAEELQPPLGKPEPGTEIQKEKILLPRVLPIKKAREKTKFQSSWFLTLSNMLLLALLVYLGFYTVQNLHNAGLMAEAAATVTPAPAGIAVRPENASGLLSDYRFISERNIFNISKKEAPGPKKEIVVEKLSRAKKDLGLLLVGTAVAYDSRLSRALIDNHKTRQQEVYREGDKAGEAQIIKILRNKVIIATKEGDRLLTVEVKTSAKGKITSAAAQQIPGSSTLRSQSIDSITSGARTRSISLDRQEVEVSLANTDQLLQELTISPYMRFQKPAGFRISNISDDSIFSKMGLSNKDVIVGINDQKIISPDQAAEFFNTILESGEVTILARRRLRTRRINLNIE
jgi:general secretion pathway protein C